MIEPIQTTQPKRIDNGRRLAMATTAGAIAGGLARYVVPTKSELSSVVNKENFDTFVSSTAMKTRGQNRSMLKYAGIGAVLTAGLAMLTKVFSKNDTSASKANDIEYSKYGALIDAPDYAVEIMWYGDEDEEI